MSQLSQNEDSKEINGRIGPIPLAGKPLSEEELKSLIDSSRKSGKVDLKTAHDMIREKFKGVDRR